MITDQSHPPSWHQQLLAVTDGKLRLWLRPKETVALSPLGTQPDKVAGALHAPGIEREWERASAVLSGTGLPGFTGATHFGERRALYHLARSLAPSSILEIGTHLGAGTTALALALAHGPPGNKRLVTVDITEVNAPGVASLPEMLRALGVENLVTRVRRSSLDYLAETRERFDLVFLDGAHDAHHVYQEIARATHRVADGGYILLHDYFPAGRPIGAAQYLIAGPYRAVHRLQREAPDLVVAPLGRLPWPTTDNVHATTLAVLGRKG